MESSIATFLMRWSACELLPTVTTQENNSLPPAEQPSNQSSSSGALEISAATQHTTVTLRGWRLFEARPYNRVSLRKGQ